jgi:GrpB-like predicted nucleotidyltransferase (UPF0157 family)
MDTVKLQSDLFWDEQFATERDRIHTQAGDGLCGIFHIGSTAVRDLAAKPLLDVLAVFDGYDPARETAGRLVDSGYTLRKDEPAWIQVTRTGEYNAFSHIRPRHSDAWRNQLVVREFLRDNPRSRRGYERVKRAAVDDHADDPEAYTAAKAEFIQSIQRRAYEEGYEDRIPTLDGPSSE